MPSPSRPGSEPCADLSRHLALLALSPASAPAAATDRRSTGVVPSFVDETRTAGIDSVYNGQWQYMVGGGVATFDCNGDGFPDMLLAGGEEPAKFYRNAAQARRHR